VSIEYGVKWDSIGPGWPEDIHMKASRAEAERAIFTSAFPGVIVRRTVTDWDVLPEGGAS
jgi:hypothetical protein